MRPGSVAVVLALLCCSLTLHAQEWTFETVASADYFDLAVETNGTPHIVYTNCTHRELCFGAPAPRRLIHTVRAAGVWMYDTLAADPSGFTPAIALDSARGVHIAYVDSLLHLQYLYGAPGEPWIKESLPHSDPNHFRNEPDIAVDDTGGVHISYNERETLWYQYRSGTGWTEEHVSSGIADNNIARSSIAIGNDGIVRIAYWNLWENGALYERAGGVWTEDLIGLDRGQFPSLALDAGNAAHILSTGFNGVNYTTDESGSWVEVVLDPDGNAGDIVLTADDVPVAAYPTSVWRFDSTITWDVSLYVSVQVDSFWQRQRLLFRQLTDGGCICPRLAVDDLAVLHLVYMDPADRSLVYGYRDVPTAVGRHSAAAEATLRLQVAPNPFNSAVRIRYSMPTAGLVRIDLFDVRGKRVRTLVNTTQEAGPHEISWNGRDGGGRSLASGVYFLRLESNGEIVTRRAVLLK